MVEGCTPEDQVGRVPAQVEAVPLDSKEGEVETVEDCTRMVIPESFQGEGVELQGQVGPKVAMEQEGWFVLWAITTTLARVVNRAMIHAMSPKRVCFGPKQTTL